jgi:hypothetical protein
MNTVRGVDVAALRLEDTCTARSQQNMPPCSRAHVGVHAGVLSAAGWLVALVTAGYLAAFGKKKA